MGKVVCITDLSYYSALDFLHFTHISLEKCVESDTFWTRLNACHVEQNQSLPLSSDYLAHTSIKPRVVPGFLHRNLVGSCLPWHVPNLSRLFSSDLLSHYFSFCILNFTKHKIAYNHTCSATFKLVRPYLQFVMPELNSN